MRKILITAFAVIVPCVLAIPLGSALADPSTDVGFRGWGPRLGMSINADQIDFGAHMDFGTFAQHVRFQPNIEVGVGDGMTLVALNGEAAYRFSSDWDSWTPYLGGGLGLNIASADKGGGSSTDLGVNALGGIEKGIGNGSRWFLETKLGLVNGPDVKFTTGWTFYH